MLDMKKIFKSACSIVHGERLMKYIARVTLIGIYWRIYAFNRDLPIIKLTLNPHEKRAIVFLSITRSLSLAHSYKCKCCFIKHICILTNHMHWHVLAAVRCVLSAVLRQLYYLMRFDEPSPPFPLFQIPSCSSQTLACEAVIQYFVRFPMPGAVW